MNNLINFKMFDELLEKIISADSLESLIKILAILLAAVIIVKISLILTGRLRKFLEGTALAEDERIKLRTETISKIINNCIIIFVSIISLMLILGQVGINIAPILAGAGVLGLAISFGAQSLIKDIITGFFILLEDQYGIGDVIQVDKYAGTVEHMSLRTTTLRDLAGSVHIIPNGEIKQVTVMTKCWSRALVDIKVFYKQDIQNIFAIINEESNKLAFEWQDRILEQPNLLGIDSIDPNGITIRVLIKTKAGCQWQVERELRRRIIERFNNSGIELPFFQSSNYVVS